MSGSLKCDRRPALESLPSFVQGEKTAKSEELIKKTGAIAF